MKKSYTLYRHPAGKANQRKLETSSMLSSYGKPKKKSRKGL